MKSSSSAAVSSVLNVRLESYSFTFSNRSDPLVSALFREVGGLDPVRLVAEHTVDRVGAHSLRDRGMLGGGAAHGGAEHQALRERVRPQAVRPVGPGVG